MRITLPKLLWLIAAFAIAWGINTWRQQAVAQGLASVQGMATGWKLAMSCRLLRVMWPLAQSRSP